jgi:hypothetical protein
VAGDTTRPEVDGDEKDNGKANKAIHKKVKEK